MLKEILKKSLKNYYEFQIGYHSRFNPECNTERGFIDSLSIVLGIKVNPYAFKYGDTFLHSDP